MKVSALISAYHASGFMHNRILNLFGQKKLVKDMELIVVAQEGSVEEDIAKSYSTKVISTPDIPTIGKAWNLAIYQAEGEYLTTANTDDKFMIGGLNHMVDVLDNNPEIGLVFSQVHIEDGQECYPWKRIDEPTGEVVGIKNILERRCIIGPMPLWRKSIHDKIGLFDEDMVVASDYDMWLRMVRGGHRMFYIAESLGIYAKRPGSLEHRNKREGWMEAQKARARR